MRFLHKPSPKIGDKRERKGFLLFPKKIREETRWLEFAEWEDWYIEVPFFGAHWVSAQWLDKDGER